MFRKDLREKLNKIFGLRKTTFDDYSDHYEQDTLFIEVVDSRSKITGSKIRHRVTGSLIVFSQVEKMPYGFFLKRIEQADENLKRDFFFFDIDNDIVSSPARFMNLHERRVSFSYSATEQYDPNKGSITSLNMECK